MSKTIMEEAIEEVRRNGRLDIQERVFAKMKPHDPLADLVARFSKALLEKLRAAEAKYGYNNDWMRPDWEARCQRHLAEHLAKGDPRDVAAYAAFCWHHGWSTSQWQPIDTAPKDGTPVIIGSQAGVGEAWFSASDAKWRWPDGEETLMKPTDWMPLPSSPLSRPHQQTGES